jgi:integrase
MRRIGNLSTARVRTATPKDGRRALVLPDGGNLYLQVTRGNGGFRRSWTFRYEYDGRRFEMGLGPLHSLSLTEARDRARTLRQQLLADVNPLEARRAARAARRVATATAMTFEACADGYIRAHRAGWRNAKHGGQWVTTLATYVYPVIGALPVGDVDAGLVLKVLEPIWTVKPETANRVRGRIEKVLDWAKVRSYRDGENPARWRGHLDHLLPPRSKIQATVHHPALPYIELPAFMYELRARDGIAAKALEFTILTAARTGEAVGTRWSEIDLAARVWVVPAARMKARHEHRIPLSGRAIEILNRMPRTDERVFPLHAKGLLVLLWAMRPNVTVHGFRSTFRDWAGDRTAFARDVVEAALAHAIGDKTEAAYRRGSAFEKRRQLMDIWSVYCSMPAQTGDVIAIGRGR